MLPRPACGERAGVRGLLPVVPPSPAVTEDGSAPHPEAAQLPTSPHERGEVSGGAANSFTRYEAPSGCGSNPYAAARSKGG